MPRMQGKNWHLNGRCHPWCGDVEYLKGRARERAEAVAEVNDELAAQEWAEEWQLLDWPALCPRCHMPSRNFSEGDGSASRYDGYCWQCLSFEDDGWPE